VSAPTTRPPEQSATAPNGGPAAAKRAPKAGAAQPKRISPHQLTGAQAVIRSLEELDVDVIFGIPGGAVLPVYDPLFDSQKLRHVMFPPRAGRRPAQRIRARHRQGRVCMATSG
jgi:acetolactate synthase-1/2/3 large subunit